MYKNMLRSLRYPGRADADELLEGELGRVTYLDEVDDIWHNRSSRPVNVVEIGKI